MFDTLPLNALRCFEVVARTSSFTLAAEELHVTQSAVSHQIKLLEQWLGRSLFERQGNSTKLLPHGVILSNSLSATFNELNTACRRARNGANSKSLVIAVIPSVATCWLIPRLSDFRKRFPGITTRVIYALHGHHIDFNEVDVAIIYAQQKPKIKNAVATLLLSGDSAPVCSASFLELLGEIRTPEQMLKAGLLHDTDRRGWAKWFAKATTRKLEFGEGPVFEDFNLLRAATLAGQGISLCPLTIIEDDLRSNRLIALSSVIVNSTSAYYLVESTQASRKTGNDIEYFRDWLFEFSTANKVLSEDRVI